MHAGSDFAVSRTWTTSLEALFRTRGILTKYRVLVEGEVIKELDCVNKRVAGRIHKEWYQDNKQYKLEYAKQHYQNNKQHKLEYAKHYRDNHKQERAEYDRQLYVNNKQKIKARQSKSYHCDCGITITWGSKSRHFRSKKHKDYITFINN